MIFQSTYKVTNNDETTMEHVGLDMCEFCNNDFLLCVQTLERAFDLDKGTCHLLFVEI